MKIAITLLTLHLHLPECASLKEKRGRLKPLLAGLQREFNLSAAEVDYQDDWQESLVACALVSSDAVHNRQVMQKAVVFVEDHWPDLPLWDHQIEQL